MSGGPASGTVSRRPPPSRSGAQYARKRASQACLTCRARKSRCDNQRPKCGFCVGSGADCNYPGSDLSKLDSASLLILDRLERVEENILGQLQAPAKSTADGCDGRFNDQQGKSSRGGGGEIWMNGDRVMTWKSIFDIQDAATSESWARFRRDVDDAQASESGILPMIISPTIMLEDLAMDVQCDASSIFQQQGGFALATTDMLVKNYIELVHSRYPILDVNYLRYLMETVGQTAQSTNGQLPTVDLLAQVLQPSDLTIFFLALALGEVATMSSARTSLFPSSVHLQRALLFAGLAVFGQDSLVKSLQAQLLLASYYMWTLKPWKAWKVIDTATLMAEKALFKRPNVKESTSGHRVLWTVSKMHLELMEELQVHSPAHITSSLTAFMKASTLPHPNTEPFSWPGVDPALGSRTWYYYLAETSSRRLIERIKDEMYSGNTSPVTWSRLPTGTSKPTDLIPEVAHLVSLYNVACELYRQIDEWSNSLPENFKTSVQLLANNTASSPLPAFADINPQAMSKYLWNRECQLRLITFRPFISLLAQLPTDGIVQEHQQRVLLRGAKTYLTHALQFIHSQSPSPERHYGTWLFGRNLWTVALTILSACNTPMLYERMDYGAGTPNEHTSPGGSTQMMVSPISDVKGSLCLYGDAIMAVEKALDMIGNWKHESASLEACAQLLSALLARTRQLRG
ncbi:hypothetical protein S40288_06901 [Stachybotrys chartarum IBT 40288]|nr:hypothetical protein S40288_06901 [Stachybotrys chartarum IBT 40288]